MSRSVFPIISPTVLQWTGASPWMDLGQRALVWEAREPDVYVNIFFGFPFADVPDVGMTVQVLTNGNPELAEQVGARLAGTIWRQREALLKSTKIHSIAEGVALAKAGGRERLRRRWCWPITATAPATRPGCCGRSSRRIFPTR